MSNKNFDYRAKGAVLILVLFAAAVAVTGYLYRQSSRQAQPASVEEPIMETVGIATQSTQAPSQPTQAPNVPAMATTPAETVPKETPQPTQAPEEKAMKTASPVSGDTITDYAMDCLSYNETTRDWRTHNGIDLAAEDGAPVCAAADGTVYTTYEDDTMGYTVVIRHAGGYTTRYSSLKETLCVKPGETVTLGQTIGYAGDTALVESVMGSHVHFSVSYQDKPMDPEEFFALS